MILTIRSIRVAVETVVSAMAPTAESDEKRGAGQQEPRDGNR